MTDLFVLFSSAVLFVALAVSLSDINPYQSEEVPMLDQIEAFMRSSSSPSTEIGIHWIWLLRFGDRVAWNSRM
jgi:hypothetical protein